MQCKTLIIDTAPNNENDYDAYVDSSGVMTGSSAYSNKTSVYVWGQYASLSINGITYNAYNNLDVLQTYSEAVKVDLTGNYTIYMRYAFPGGSND